MKPRTLFYIIILINLFVILFCSVINADEVQYKIDHLLQPVVRISHNKGNGSGVVICVRDKKDGYRNFIITNFHIIEDVIGLNEKEEETRDLVVVKNYIYTDKGNSLIICTGKALIIKYSKEFDLALLELVDKSVQLSSIPLLPKDKKLELFQPVFNVGFPQGTDLIFVPGIINGINKNSIKPIGFMSNYIKTTAPIWFGSSGGLTSVEVDNTFYLAGIPSMVRVADNNIIIPYINFCISVKSLRSFLRLSNLDFVEDNNVPIPEFKKYPRPPRKFNINIYDFIPWRKQDE